MHHNIALALKIETNENNVNDVVEAHATVANFLSRYFEHFS